MEHSMEGTQNIIWEPSGDYIHKSNIKRFMDKHGIKTYDDLIKRSVDDTEWFWDAALKDLGVEWYEPYKQVKDESKGFPWTKWFIGGKINIVHNCIDRHIKAGRGDRIAFIYESDEGEVKNFTYAQLNAEVCKLANAMRKAGIEKGDTVGLYIPMTPEMVFAFFATLKIGAIVIPVFSGFGALALGTRLEDGEAKMIFTADGGIRRGKKVAIKQEADKAIESVPSMKKVVVLKRTGDAVPWKEGRDVWYHDFVAGQPETAETEVMEAEEYCMIIFTSGTTGRPKGTVHTHAGALAQIVKEVAYYTDMKETDIFWWMTDIGWMMGPWLMIGSLHQGGTFVVFEGTPNYPNNDRLWEVCARHKVTIFGISPTAIRMMITYGDEDVKKHDLSKLRLLASSGETWDPASYMWHFNNVGGGRCPIINISGGTEIVGCLLSPLPITALKACTLRGPGLAMDIDVFDEEGKSVRGGIGHLVCKKPAPSMTKGFLKDPERYIETYFSKFPNVWYHGDWAHIDSDGFWFLHGRSDDTIKIAGKRTGPAEIESALIKHKSVAECAAIGVPHEIKGEGAVCFVVLKPGFEPSEKLRGELSDQVVKELGKTLKPEKVLFVNALPKTRSAKIVRGSIKRKYLGQPPGDLSSVENPDAIEEISRAK